MQKAVDLIAQINSWVDEIPPIQQPMRFGNRAFRDFYDRVVTVRAFSPLHEQTDHKIASKEI